MNNHRLSDRLLDKRRTTEYNNTADIIKSSSFTHILTHKKYRATEKLHKQKHNEFYPPPHTIKVKKARRKRCSGHVERKGRTKMHKLFR